MSLCTSWTRIILICVCGWHKIGWKETKSWSDVESAQQRSWFGRTNISPWSCILGMHSKTMLNNQRYCGQLQNHVRIANFRGKQKNCHPLKIFVFLHGLYDMEGDAKKCVERYCELANKTTQQLYKVSTPCIDDHHFKEEETKSVGELSNTCSQIVLRNSCLQATSKRTQEDAGEERVTAESKPMMNLVSRCSERTLEVQQTFFNLVNVLLRHNKHLLSCEIISQKIFIPSKIQEGISQWNKCLTYLNCWTIRWHQWSEYN